MRKLIYILIAAALISCKKTEVQPTEPIKTVLTPVYNYTLTIIPNYIHYVGDTLKVWLNGNLLISTKKIQKGGFSSLLYHVYHFLKILKYKRNYMIHIMIYSYYKYVFKNINQQKYTSACDEVCCNEKPSLSGGAVLLIMQKVLNNSS